MAMNIELSESGPLSATFLMTTDNDSGLDYTFALPDWQSLPEGPLKTLLTTRYLTEEGEFDSAAFLSASSKLGLSFHVTVLDSGPYTANWTPAFVPGNPIGYLTFYFSKYSGKAASVGIYVMHSLVK